MRTHSRTSTMDVVIARACAITLLGAVLVAGPATASAAALATAGSVPATGGAMPSLFATPTAEATAALQPAAPAAAPPIVPNVVRLSGKTAVKALKNAGYNVEVVKPRYDAKVARGYISAQVAKGGTQMRRGRTVLIATSLGPAPKYNWKSAKASVYGGPSESQHVAGPYGTTSSLERKGVLYFAHKSMAFGTKVLFRCGRHTVTAICVDRGPYVSGRTFDLGVNTARALGFGGVGTVSYAIVK